MSKKRTNEIYRCWKCGAHLTEQEQKTLDDTLSDENIDSLCERLRNGKLNDGEFGLITVLLISKDIVSQGTYEKIMDAAKHFMENKI